MNIRDFTVDLYYPLCVSRRIDTWHIVYLSNKDPCPKILAHKSEIKVPFKMSHGNMDSDGNFSIQKVARPRGTNLQLAVNSHKFHRCPCCPYDRDPYTMGKLSAKYQFCAIHTADNTDGKVTIDRRCPSFLKKSIV